MFSSLLLPIAYTGASIRLCQPKLPTPVTSYNPDNYCNIEQLHGLNICFPLYGIVTLVHQKKKFW
jgi:hypothetical protein